jgi:hypothetical protein
LAAAEVGRDSRARVSRRGSTVLFHGLAVCGSNNDRPSAAAAVHHVEGPRRGEEDAGILDRVAATILECVTSSAAVRPTFEVEAAVEAGVDLEDQVRIP